MSNLRDVRLVTERKLRQIKMIQNVKDIEINLKHTTHKTMYSIDNSRGGQEFIGQVRGDSILVVCGNIQTQSNFAVDPWVQFGEASSRTQLQDAISDISRTMGVQEEKETELVISDQKIRQESRWLVVIQVFQNRSRIDFIQHRLLSVWLRKFTGIIPNSISTLTMLQVLDMSSNSLSGSIPNFGSLALLRELYLYSNALTGRIPSSLCSSSSLTTIRVFRYNDDDRLLLNNSQNHLQCNNKCLQSVATNDLHMTTIYPCHTDDDLVSLDHRQMTATLQTSSPDDTSVNASLCDIAASLSPSSWPSFRGWNCSGGVPTTRVCIADQSMWSGVQCVSGVVRSLVLENAVLQGSIPDSIGGLSSVTRISLRQNFITGTIPSSLSTISSLANLNLQFNSLSGSIPESLAGISSLSFLGLASNLLDKSIPTSLGKSSRLSHVLLYDNLLSGTVPASLCTGNSLQMLLLFYPTQQSYVLNSHLKCYAKCLSTVSNAGYSSAYGNLKVCSTTSTLLDKTSDFLGLGISRVLGYVIIGAIVIVVSTVVVLLWRCVSSSLQPRQTARPAAAPRQQQQYRVPNEYVVFEEPRRPVIVSASAPPMPHPVYVEASLPSGYSRNHIPVATAVPYNAST